MGCSNSALKAQIHEEDKLTAAEKRNIVCGTLGLTTMFCVPCATICLAPVAIEAAQQLKVNNGQTRRDLDALPTNNIDPIQKILDKYYNK